MDLPNLYTQVCVPLFQIKGKKESEIKSQRLIENYLPYLLVKLNSCLHSIVEKKIFDLRFRNELRSGSRGGK